VAKPKVENPKAAKPKVAKDADRLVIWSRAMHMQRNRPTKDTQPDKTKGKQGKRKGADNEVPAKGIQAGRWHQRNQQPGEQHTAQATQHFGTNNQCPFSHEFLWFCWKSACFLHFCFVSL